MNNQSGFWEDKAIGQGATRNVGEDMAGEVTHAGPTPIRHD